MDDDTESFVRPVVLVQALLLREWARQRILFDCLTVPGVASRCGFACPATGATDTAVRFARILAAGAHWQRLGGVTSAHFGVQSGMPSGRRPTGPFVWGK